MPGRSASGPAGHGSLVSFTVSIAQRRADAATLCRSSRSPRCAVSPTDSGRCEVLPKLAVTSSLRSAFPRPARGSDPEGALRESGNAEGCLRLDASTVCGAENGVVSQPESTDWVLARPG